MNKSDSIGKLATALSLLQGEIKDAHKDKKGYGYNYADLSQVLEITRPLLTKHGLAVTQLCGHSDNKVTVETVLMHTSDQWVSSTIEMSVEPMKGMTKAQAVGCIITYARRYALAAIVGITQTDTDAHAENAEVVSRNAYHVKQGEKINDTQLNYIKELVDNESNRIAKIIKWYSINFYPINNILEIDASAFVKTIDAIKKSLPKTTQLTKDLEIINSIQNVA